MVRIGVTAIAGDMIMKVEMSDAGARLIIPGASHGQRSLLPALQEAKPRLV